MRCYQAVRDTLTTLLADPKYRGAQPGIIAALHTWSQTLVLHPHLHCLVTGGGLTPAGTWVAVRHGHLLPMRVVMAVFRGKMVDAIRQTFARGALVLPEPMRGRSSSSISEPPRPPDEDEGNVRIMERHRHGAGVVTYLARYLRVAPSRTPGCGPGMGLCHLHLSRARGGVSVRGALRQRMTLPVADFLQRWLLHVPSPHTRRCGRMGSTIMPTPRRLPAVAPRSGKRPGAPNGPGLAYRVCPTGRRASGTVCHLWSAPGVHRCHPRGGAPPPVRARERAA